MKIFISPSNQTANAYKGVDTNECIQCEKIASALSAELVKCGFETKVANRNDDVNARCKASKAWGADLHIPIHTNAGGGKGIEVYVNKNASSNVKEKAKKLSSMICDNIKAISASGASRGVKEATFQELTDSTFAVYPEIEFHDNATYAKWICENTEVIAKALCKAICNFYGTESTYTVEINFNNMADAEAIRDAFKVLNADVSIRENKAVSAKPVEPSKPAEPVKALKVGSTVKVKEGAKTYTGGNLASYVYTRLHKVEEISGNRVVISYNGVTIAAMRDTDLIIQ